MKVIKITELGPSEKISKIHKKWGDKAGLSHKFLFKRKDEKFPVCLPLPLRLIPLLSPLIPLPLLLRGAYPSMSHFFFLFLQKLHDPRTVVEDYTLEMRASSEISKKGKSEGKGGKKTEADFHDLITSVLSVFAERVEELFFHFHENVEGNFCCFLFLFCFWFLNYCCFLILTFR